MDSFLQSIVNDSFDILRNNGFVDIENDDAKDYHFHLKNDNCEVYVRGDGLPISPEYYYEIIFKFKGEKASVYSKDLNIYWLLGFLTHNKLMIRDYK